MEKPGLGRAFLCLGCWLEGAHAGWLMLRFAQIGARRLFRLACRPTRFFPWLHPAANSLVWSTLRAGLERRLISVKLMAPPN